ncbi:MAG TPA: DsbA family oxidoreductase, partial [Stellaceae bacterium]|nr:DsbA family oxidoreductase [Stellaceae bacterium]
MRVTVTITSDFICPWCFIGERRLERAIATLPPEVQVDLQWRPFELNHDMPVEGMDRMVYRSAKFGSWERSQAMDAEVAAVGKVNGIEFAYDRITRIPNTFAAHRLMWLAGEAGNPTLLADKLSTAYFTDAFDLSDPEVLKRIGADAGLPAARVAAVIDDGEGAKQVRQLEAEAHRLGIRGVPLLRIGNVVISGARTSAVLAEALRAA